jgi:hypothetical protein
MSPLPFRTHLVRFGFVAAALLFPRAAAAQAEQSFKLPNDEPPPATTAPAPATTTPAPPATTAPAPATTTPAPAATPVPTPEPPADASPSEEAGQPRARENKHKSEPELSGLVFSTSGGTLGIKGRVFALAELSHRNETVVSTSGGLTNRDRNALDLTLDSARFGFEYRSPLRWLSATLELEVAGRPQVKDAYIRAGKRFFAKVGQFKLPSAALELESPWTIPLARRGFVHDLLLDWLDVAGRRPGLAFGYRGKGELKPRLTLGAFQGTTLEELVPGDRDVELIDHASLEAQTFAARAELRVLKVELGAWYEQRVGSKLIGEFEHFATLGLDATLDHELASGGVRVWLDGSGGQSLYVHQQKPDQAKVPLFASGRALLAYRFGGVELGQPYLEPFGSFALLDPDLEVVDDFATEAALGVNAGFWDRAKLTLQGEMTSAQRNFPGGFLDHQNPEHLSLLLRAGARF